MKTLLSIPDRTTSQGTRDYALLMFLYNSGARATEAVNLRIQDIAIGDGTRSALVTIRGKGNKTRVCPLWDSTVKLLQPYMKRNPYEPVFLNRYGNPITRYGVYELVARYAARAAEIMPSISGKNVSPHTIRHSTASHLLEAGVDINTIRSWLGHVSVNTTNIYAEVNIRMKAKALKTCEVFVKGAPKYNPKDKTLIGFLKSL
jgi:site-specific recombinase XerD